ncbi:recombinase family protein [Dyella psychrodurans]|uniref:Recombinase family protein n=1 Tax=Dyella psychrodurans TaxID=1927960 RepID=A0A370WV57_9GAMM|nr:recombinase family protein [Dyella psychrodurans]RDS80018.1 recombinase family protein [Dyella psychrodurans]
MSREPIHSNAEVQTPSRRGVLYMRMSTDKQQYSLANQAHALFAYAEKHNIAVARTYSDEAKSGLTFEGRKGLQELIRDVQKPERQFEVVLTYDVSRWGRFQNTDEAAYYEHICKRAGVNVIYCAEAFDDYAAPISGILKNLKRAMAAEYSRELSVKVSQAHQRLAALGYHQGSYVGIGLRRAIVTPDGRVLGTLEDGQRRRGYGDRVRVVPGPEHEIAVVRRIFDAFTIRNLQATQIMDDLNKDPSTWLRGAPWTFYKIRKLLTDERYIGTMIFRCYDDRFTRKTHPESPCKVIRYEHAFPPLIPVTQFREAAERIQYRFRTFDDETMIRMLKRLYEERGRISKSVIESSYEMPKYTTYRDRFGTLLRAYEMAGIPTFKNCSYIDRNRTKRIDTENALDQLMDELRLDEHLVVPDRKHNIVLVDNRWSIFIRLIRARPNRAGKIEWIFQVRPSQRADFLLLIRLDKTGEIVFDQYLVPMLSIRPGLTRMSPSNDLGTDMYRINSFSAVRELAERYFDDVTECTDRFARRRIGCPSKSEVKLRRGRDL